jgi:hypothetical protein
VILFWRTQIGETTDIDRLGPFLLLELFALFVLNGPFLALCIPLIKIPLSSIAPWKDMQGWPGSQRL